MADFLKAFILFWGSIAQKTGQKANVVLGNTKGVNDVLSHRSLWSHQQSPVSLSFVLLPLTSAHKTTTVAKRCVLP
jgi:hypothetical protein